jgi:peptide-methionine (R)-S-oxide reductase
LNELVAHSDATRRTFLSVLALAMARPLNRDQPALGGGPPKEVVIAQFSDAGVRLGTVRVPKVEKSEREWRAQLSPLAFEVTRHGKTEVPFTGEYWNLHEKGLFRCICCDTALFHSDTKFDSGTGWPSFWQVIAKENVVRHPSRSRAYLESEVTCKRCDAHLGDVFDDGPKPTGLRYCIDSVALRFVKPS